MALLACHPTVHIARAEGITVPKHCELLLTILSDLFGGHVLQANKVYAGGLDEDITKVLY